MALNDHRCVDARIRSRATRLRELTFESSSGRCADGGSAETSSTGAAPTRASAWRGRSGGCDGVRVGGVDRAEAGLRVPGADGGTLGRGPTGEVGGDGSGRAGVDGAGRANEGRAGTPSAAEQPGGRDPRRGSPAGRRLNRRRAGRAGVSGSARQGDPRRHALGAASAAGHRGGAARFPLQLPRLGVGADGPPARGDRALAHVVRNQTEAAYARSDLFERRGRVMNDWMRYLTGQPRTGSRSSGTDTVDRSFST